MDHQREVPACLRPSFYFDHLESFQHRGLFHREDDTVLQALDRVHSYSKSWLGKLVEAKLAEKSCQCIVLQAENLRQRGGEHITLIEPSSLCKMTTRAPRLIVLGSDPIDLRRYHIDRIILPRDDVDDNHDLIIHPSCSIFGGVCDLRNGSIFIDADCIIEPASMLCGPAILGANVTLRHGAYVRGDAILGKYVVLRGEVKNVIIMDKAQLCHPSYCGDSICGYSSHFGNQATTANLGLLSGADTTVKIDIDGIIFDTQRRKIGIILGDFSQLGCNTVTDPGTLIGKNTHVYPLTMLKKGIYGPHELIKNKPMHHGVVERVPLRREEKTTN